MKGTAGVAGRRRRLVRFGSGQAWSPDQVALGVLSSAGALIFLLALRAASGGFDPIFWLLVPLPGMLVWRNDSGVPLAYWGLMLFGWFQLTPSGSFTPWSVVAATGLLLGHASAALSASAPPTAAFPGLVVRRWTRRALVGLAAAVAVGLAAGLLSGEVDGLGPLAQAAGLAGLALGVWLLRSEAPE